MAEQQNPLKPLFKDIADAIREKDGTTALIPSASDFPERIRAIPTGGLPEGVRTITVTADPTEGGSVSGGGVVSTGMDVTATVNANPTGEYEFDGWEDGGAIVSCEKSYSFPVTKDVRLVGKFSIPQFVIGQDWWETTLPMTACWSGVTYANGKFLAFSCDGKAMFSLDGINWIDTSFANYPLSSATYGNGTFVIVSGGYGSNSPYASYSYDGINWKTSHLPTSSGWIGVTYGNGVFVAVSRNKKAAYSVNGINWVETTIPIYCTSVTYGNGMFVAMPYSGNKAAVSIDGINWIEITLPSSLVGTSVAYGNGMFVAVSQGNNGSSNKAIYSKNGSSWTEITLPSSELWSSITYGNGKFVAVAGSSIINSATLVNLTSNKVIYSEDGINWTESALPSSERWSGITYGNGKFVAVSGGVYVNNKPSDKAAYSSATGPAA